MPRLEKSSTEVGNIEQSLSEWRQGDVTLEANWFTHVADPSKALTAESGQAEGTLEAITSEVEGLVVLTQSCDIVRSCIERPFLEISPLVKVAPSTLHEIKRGQRPSYAFIPTLEKDYLVADLDRVMTLEKSIVASWKRIQGCSSDEESRSFAQALARKRARFAFPDDFVEFVSKLQERIKEKHNRQSEEGKALRNLREIRVSAIPSWKAAQVNLFFLFIRSEDEPTFSGKSWDILLEQWLKLIPSTGRFTDIDGMVVTLENITANEYLQSDPLDLDHLSRKF